MAKIVPYLLYSMPFFFLALVPALTCFWLMTFGLGVGDIEAHVTDMLEGTGA